MAFVLQRVLISDDLDEVCASRLRAEGLEVVQNTKLTREQLLDEVKRCDTLVVRSATRVDATVLASPDCRLKVVGRAGVGVDNIDCEVATAQGILVLNTPSGNTLSAAEHACALICSLARHIPAACASMKAGQWDKKSFMGHELSGKTLAILGLGRIGRTVAQRMQAFGMRTIGFDPLVSPEVAATFGVELMSLDAIWPVADYFTIHTPLLPQTENLFRKETFNKCKKGFRLVNCARGGIVNESDLLETLKSGQCGGAAVDVFTEEPPKSEVTKELIQHPRVICTPHLGASTTEAQAKVAEEIAEALVALTNGRELRGAINGQSVSQALSQSAQPWVKLCMCLGHLMRHLTPDEKLFHVSVFIPGHSEPPSFVEAAVAMGLVVSKPNQPLNLINSKTKAQEAGVQISVQMNTFAAALSTPSIKICAAFNNKLSVTGAVFCEQPVLVQFCGETLNQPLSIGNPEASSERYLTVFCDQQMADEAASSSVWSSLIHVTNCVCALTRGDRNVFLLTSQQVQIPRTVFICPL